MKKLIATSILAGLASANASFVDDLSISGSFNYESEYVFRGLHLADHSFQPSVEFGYGLAGGDAYFGIWNSSSLIGSGGEEIDFYLGYAYAIDDTFTLDVGFTYYFYPNEQGLDRSREVYVGVSADTVLSPALYFYYDFDLEQTLFELSVGHSIELNDLAGIDAALDLGGYVGFASADDILGGQGPGGVTLENGYTYWGLTADLIYSLSETASASIGARYSGNNDGEFLVRENNFWFGTSISFAK